MVQQTFKKADDPSHRIWRGQVDVEFEEYAAMKCKWLKPDSNQGIPEAKKSGERHFEAKWILARLSDLKQPWLETGEARACSTCYWRSMHECSVGWLKHVLANSRSLFWMDRERDGKVHTVNSVQTMTFDRQNLESFGLELSILCS